METWSISSWSTWLCGWWSKAWGPGGISAIVLVKIKSLRNVRILWVNNWLCSWCWQ